MKGHWCGAFVLTLLLLLLQLAADCSGIVIINDVPLAVNKSMLEERNVAAASYRVSLPQTQRPMQRVPAHLQSIRQQGFTYDDADDVIHIVEPPQYFQQLKRRFNQQGAVAMVRQQQQPQRHLHQPNGYRSQAPASLRQPIELASKVKELPQVYGKVAVPHKSRGASATASVKPVAGASATRGSNNSNKEAKTRSAVDLLTQESQQLTMNNEQPHSLAHFSAFPASLPLEILASVRQTDRLMHKPKSPHTPYANAKQRFKTKKTHTVVWEKRFEREQFQHDNNQHKLAVQKRTRPNVALGDPSSPQSAKRRSRRDTKPKVNVQMGQQLLLHIAELLRNASYYLPSEGIEEQGIQHALKPATLNQLRTHTRTDAQPKQLSGELKPKRSSDLQQPQQIYNILQNYINATQVIMREVTRRLNVSNPLAECGQNRTLTATSRLQQLQQHIYCAREKLRAPNEGVGKLSYDERQSKAAEEIDIAVTTASTSTKQQSSFICKNSDSYSTSESSASDGTTDNSDTASLHDCVGNSTTSLTEIGFNSDSGNLSESLLYADVMANIRNMLQTNNLRLLEEQQTTSDAAGAETNGAHLDASDAPRFIPASDREDFADFNNFNQYLHELQQIVYNLPRRAQTTAGEPTPNSHEVSLDAHSREWYLINGEGQIYETPLETQFKTTAAVFHRFPDIPNAEELLRNRTPSKQLSNVLEVL